MAVDVHWTCRLVVDVLLNSSAREANLLVFFSLRWSNLPYKMKPEVFTCTHPHWGNRIFGVKSVHKSKVHSFVDTFVINETNAVTQHLQKTVLWGSGTHCNFVWHTSMSDKHLWAHCTRPLTKMLKQDIHLKILIQKNVFVQSHNMARWWITWVTHYKNSKERSYLKTSQIIFRRGTRKPHR